MDNAQYIQRISDGARMLLCHSVSRSRQIDIEHAKRELLAACTVSAVHVLPAWIWSESGHKYRDEQTDRPIPHVGPGPSQVKTGDRRLA
jgi:hypothetical protein